MDFNPTKEEFHYGTFDIESREWIDFEILGMFDGEDYRTYTTINGFLDGIDRRKYRGWSWYAHNGGKFDFLFLIEELLRRGWVRRIIERGGRMIQIECVGDHVAFDLRDSYALLPDSLEDLAESFGAKHQKLAIDYKKIRKNDPATLKYLKEDVLALHEIITKWLDLEYVITPRLTIASQALDTFSRTFIDGDLVQMPIDYDTVVRENFYSGGRVEVFKGHGTVNSYDVNSLYPYVMKTEMPCGEVSRVRSYRPGRLGFYQIEVTKAPDNYLGLFQMRGGKKNYFVNGPGTYSMSSDTLEFLVSTFGIKYNVKFGLVFADRGRIFDDYVDFFFALKKSAAKDSPARFLAKMMLNSLYGKLGQKPDYETLVMDTGRHKTARPADPFLSTLGLVYVPRKGRRSKFVLPYLAAMITDRARLHHLKLMLEHPKEMFYCDTDSLYTSADYSHRVSAELGDLSNTGTWEGIFLSPKCYALKSRRPKQEVVHFKGFSTEDFSYADFQSAVKGKILRQTKERILSFKEAAKRKNGIKKEAGAFLKLVDQQKVATMEYDKRLTFPDKERIFDSRAFTFEEVTAASTTKPFEED